MRLSYRDETGRSQDVPDTEFYILEYSESQIRKANEIITTYYYDSPVPMAIKDIEDFCDYVVTKRLEVLETLESDEIFRDIIITICDMLHPTARYITLENFYKILNDDYKVQLGLAGWK